MNNNRIQAIGDEFNIFLAMFLLRNATKITQKIHSSMCVRVCVCVCLCVWECVSACLSDCVIVCAILTASAACRNVCYKNECPGFLPAAKDTPVLDAI